jgi:hypothetical protein
MPEAEAEPDCCFTCAARTLLSPGNDPAARLHLPAHQRTDLHECNLPEEATDMSEDTQWMLDKQEVDRVIKANKAMYRRWLRDTLKEVACRLEEAFKKNKVKP